MKLKLFVIGTIFIALTCVVVFMYKDRSVEETANLGGITPKIMVQPPPRTIVFPSTPESSIFMYTGANKVVPSSLLTYEVTEAESPESLMALGASLSEKFGLKATPSATTRGDAFAYIRNDQYKWFSISKTKGVCSVSFQHILSQGLENIQMGKEGVVSLLPTMRGAPLLEYAEIPNIGASSSDGLTILDRPIPTLTSHVYGVRVGGFQVLTKEYTRRWAGVTLDDRGVIRLLSYILPPSISPSREVATISIDDAVKNIQSGNGSILWVSQRAEGTYGATPSFTRANLTRYSVVYIYDGNLLVPAYAFEGEGDSQGGQPQAFEMLVRAYSDF